MNIKWELYGFQEGLTFITHNYSLNIDQNCYNDSCYGE